MTLFARKADQGTFTALVGLANDVHAAIPGSLIGTRLTYRDAEVDLAIAADRDAVLTSLSAAFDQLPHNPDQWASTISIMEEELNQAERSSEYRYQLAAFMILITVIKFETICKVAEKFPKDDRIQNIVNMLLNETGGVLDHFFGQDVVFELFMNFQYARRWLERKVGIRD